MVKSLAIYCVNYRSYAETHTYLTSISRAAALADGQLEVSVFVIDNTERDRQSISTDFPHIRVTVFPNSKNNGYLGAVQECMKVHPATPYDYVAISNVDLEMEESALTNLAEMEVPADCGWLAPSICSDFEHRNKNPKMLQRYGRRRLQILLLMYTFPLLMWLYERTVYSRKSVAQVAYPAGMEIYGGHGSFMLFTRAFFERIPALDYPIFLFGEEIYLAELCLQHNLRVLYAPQVIVLDSEHCSTGTLRYRNYCKRNAEALRYLLKRFYTSNNG